MLDISHVASYSSITDMLFLIGKNISNTSVNLKIHPQKKRKILFSVKVYVSDITYMVQI